ncbi:MAG: HIT family protein [Phycisphaerae bacterium]|nr:HIT family protein [Phycisphaerae bacterium]
MDESGCIFCKIAAGEIPSCRVLESPDFLAFLDVTPLAPGHALLIPKRHYESILDVPGEVLAAIAAHLPKLAGAIMRATGASGMNVLQNTGRCSGQAVFHLHFHLIPRREGDGLGFRWNTVGYAEGEAEAMESKIIAELR